MDADIIVPASDGRWVSERFAIMSEVITDYDHHLELRWIPPDQRVETEEIRNPYVIVDKTNNTPVFFFGDDATPESVLARLFAGDNARGNVLDRLDAHNNAVRAMELRKEMEDMEEANEQAAWLLEDKRNWVHLRVGKDNKLVKFDDELRRV